MANSIERMLEINTRIEGGSKKPVNNAQPRKVATQQDLDRMIESYDKQVYGPVSEPQLKQGERPAYDARAEMEHLKEIKEHGRGQVNLEGKNIPKKILESILANPLDLEPLEDPRMTALEEKISGKGLKAAVEVFNKVEQREQEARTKLNEQMMHQKISEGNIDYDMLRNLINECLDTKLSEIKQSLNEGTARNYAPSMKYLSFKDKFYFVDNDNNVFECEMKYKGKNKKK